MANRHRNSSISQHFPRLYPRHIPAIREAAICGATDGKGLTESDKTNLIKAGIMVEKFSDNEAKGSGNKHDSISGLVLTDKGKKYVKMHNDKLNVSEFGGSKSVFHDLAGNQILRDKNVLDVQSDQAARKIINKQIAEMKRSTDPEIKAKGNELYQMVKNRQIQAPDYVAVIKDGDGTRTVFYEVITPKYSPTTIQSKTVISEYIGIETIKIMHGF